MPTNTLGRQQRSLVPLFAVTGAALIFTVLLVLVRLQFLPLESVDHGAAADLNSAIASHGIFVKAIKAVTWLGSDGVLWTVIGAAAVVLALRKRWRLAVYLLVTGAGALVLDPVLKSLVGRVRPVVAHPIAHGNGSSFPSGHSLGSIVCYGAVLLVFLPAARGRWRRVFIGGTVTLVALIGISRVLLGVHYLSDVLGAWALGITWLGITAFAFELTRQAAGQPVTDPVTEGLEPEARADLRPAKPEPAASHPGGYHRGRVAAGVVVAWVLIVGVVIGLGELVTQYGNGNVLGDRTIPHWLAAHRTPGLTRWSLVFTTLGRHHGYPHRGPRHLCGVPGRHPALAAGRLHRRGDARGTRRVPHGRGRGQAAPAGRLASRPAPADLGVPVRARGRDLLPLYRDRDPGHRPRPRLVALAVPRARRSPCRSWSRCHACTGASTTRPTSWAASCSPRCG